MRKDNFGEDYEPLDEVDMDSEPYNGTYTEIEDGVFDDLRPILNDIGPLPEYSFEHSDQLRELSGSKDDGKEEVIREYAVTTKKPLKFVKNEPKSIHVKCIQEDCDFYVFCSQINKSKDLSIKTVDVNHTCGTSMKIPTISVKWLTKKYVNKVRRTPKISLKAFIGDIYDNLKVEISISTAYRAIKVAEYLMYGNENQQFASLWSYAKAMLDITSGSTVIIKQDEQKIPTSICVSSPIEDGFFGWVPQISMS
ncbi:hypothetical protein LIER_17950 [Lithospermum erythrorhizon]|uniref:Transposase MuDR plant domain-containing protein n=1 Tax=Lithospermum erythrorhizon TaxID=34254 RepID=A0AAV3QES8_LITER